jgi:DME family drug/metabolite transporter
VGVAVLAKPILGERLTVQRLTLAFVVMAGAWLTVRGGHPGLSGVPVTGLVVGVTGGLLAAASYAGTTLLARWAVPRYGTFKVLFWEIGGGTLLLGLILPLAGQAPLPPATGAGWLFVLALAAGPVVLANVFFFNAVKRIDAAPTAIAANIEPVVGALLALMLFDQRLQVLGWIGLALVIFGVSAGYVREAKEDRG